MALNPDLHSVHLLSVPVGVWIASRNWFESLIREFDIVAADTRHSIPGELLEFVAAAREEFGHFSTAPNAVLEEASSQGANSVDVHMELPYAAAPTARSLLTHIYKADRYCREGEFLTLALTVDIRRFVEWYLTEVADQIDGADPQRWPPSYQTSGDE